MLSARLFSSAFRTELGGLSNSCFTFRADFKHNWLAQACAAEIAIVRGDCDL